MSKRKLRFFCDYAADSPLWEDVQQGHYGGYPEGEYNKTTGTLLSFGVSRYTLKLMEALQWIYEYPPHDVDLSDTEAAAFRGLKDLILERLEEEIGDKFEIEVL